MNYRHAFHAGGFADVIKHIVLVRILLHLQEKPAAFRVIDTHAGAGLYELTSDEARRGGEWLTGIARLMQARLSEATATLVKPYLDIIRAFNPERDLKAYPGSPLIARALLRPQDRLTACEIEPKARKRLVDGLRRDTQARVVDLDGWVALPAFVPPKERRGLLLVDPAYEDAGDFARLGQGLVAAHRKWASGIFLGWYPIKERTAPDALARRLRNSGIPKVLRAELSVAAPREPTRLAACGLIVINPPWRLADELAMLLPELAVALSGKSGGAHRLDWLAGER